MATSATRTSCAGRDGIVLVDWEEVGSAAPGFDAGWLLAHARVGATGRSHQELLAALIGRPAFLRKT